MRKKILLGLGLVVALLAGAFVALIGPRNVIGMLRYDQRVQGTLRVGDPMPDPTLHDLDGKATFSLRSRVAGRPLVLVFGSFT